MWYEVLLPGPVLMIPILVMTTKGTHSPKNDSNLPNDVIVTYTNHAEAHDEPKSIPNIPMTSTENIETDTDNTETSTAIEMERDSEKPVYQDDFAYAEISMTTEEPFKNEFGYKTTTKAATKSSEVFDSEIVGKKPPKATVHKKLSKLKKKKKPAPELEDDAPEDVVFIPNQRDPEPIRNEYYLQKNKASLQELMGGHKTVDDLLVANDDMVETETPGPEIIFITGKNNDAQDISTTTKRPPKKMTEEQYEKIAPKIDCTNLNCTNTIDSICGEKVDNYHPRLRLFLNDCYFRKVNCNFKMAINRYNQVPLTRCSNIGKHYSFPPYPKAIELRPEARPEPIAEPKQEVRAESKSDFVDETRRRNFSSRRSMSMNIHGQFCSHPCPSSCPELYEPECAVSSTGRHRVFVNHCALDHNSCSFGIVWHSVPLAECVGGKKAELRQNAGFIGWMQRVGVVDKRGRLAYDVDRR